MSVQARINRLPYLLRLILTARAKATALSFIKSFHDGIKNNAFGLKKLKDETIERKRRLAMELPEVPLYGRGDDKKDRSYVNMLRLRKLKAGYRVYPSKAMHYSKKVKLDKLLYVHEHGAILKGAGDTLIRIPPRPALKLAYRQTMGTQIKGDRSKKVKAEAAKYLRTGMDSYFKSEPINMTKPYKETERRATGN